MARHNNTGKWGEQAAYEHLVSHGYAIVGRNVRVGHAEIDIIAMKGNRIMFVEVKTRTAMLSDPLDAITGQKIKLLARAANSYLRSMNIMHYPQFDVITVVGEPGNFTLTHFEDAFMPPLVTYR